MTHNNSIDPIMNSRYDARLLLRITHQPPTGSISNSYGLMPRKINNEKNHQIVVGDKVCSISGHVNKAIHSKEE